MCILEMHVRCADRFFEILPEQTESAELIVENVVSTILLDLFAKVAMEEVTIVFPSNSRLGQQSCSIHIRTQCLFQFDTLLPAIEENTKHDLVKRVHPLLKELFGPVTIDSIMFIPYPWDCEHDPALSQSAERWRFA